MAGHNEEIAIKIGAKDEASKVIDGLVKKIDGMEADEARITVTAQTDKLEAQLDRAKVKLDTLEGDEATVQARLVGSLESDLEQAQALFKEIDGKTGTVTIEAHADTGELDNVKHKIDEVEGSGRAASTAVGGVGNTISELPGVGALGPMAESMGQLAEGALEGEINIGQLIGTAGGLAAVAFVAQKIGEHFENIAKVKAFQKQEVKDYTTALKDADSTLGAIKAKLEADEGLFVNWFGSEADITPAFHALGLGADEVTRLILAGKPAIDAWGESMRGAGADADGVAIVVKSLKEQTEFLDQAQQGAKVTADFFKASTDGLTVATQEQKDAFVDTTSAAVLNKVAVEKAGQAAYDASVKARRLAEKIAEATAEYDIMTGRINTSNAALDLADAFDEAATNAGKLYLQILDHSPEVEQTARDQARLQNDLKLKVIEYADELGRLPPEVITRINALVDQGDIDEAEKQLKNVTRNRDVNIRIIANGGAGYGSVLPGSPRSVTPAPPPAVATPFGATVPTATSTSMASEVVVPVRLKLPSAAQIARQLGPLNLEIKAGLVAYERLSGIRS